MKVLLNSWSKPSGNLIQLTSCNSTGNYTDIYKS